MQGELEKALLKVHKTKVLCQGSGRTDSGVHARRQAVSFDSPLRSIPVEKYPMALNAFLIFKIYAEYIITDKSIRPILNAMQDSVVMSTQGYVTPDSVTLPIVRRYREAGEPLRIVDFDAASEMLMQGFLDETRNIFNDARVWDFMEMSFGDDSEINVKEIPLPDYDAFILLILATLKTNDEQCFYTVEKLEGQVHSYGFSLPNLLFKRKELEA